MKIWWSFLHSPKGSHPEKKCFFSKYFENPKFKSGNERILRRKKLFSFTNWGYICIKKWSYIFVLGTGSALTESKEKSPKTAKKGNFCQNRLLGPKIFPTGAG